MLLKRPLEPKTVFHKVRSRARLCFIKPDRELDCVCDSGLQTKDHIIERYLQSKDNVIKKVPQSQDCIIKLGPRA